MVDRIQIRVRGRVQGVGFRPFVWREATALGLVGNIKNDRYGVLIHAAGKAPRELAAIIENSPPPLSEIHAIEIRESKFEPADKFLILESEREGVDTGCPPDAAICADCRAEIGGDGRRSSYAFTNCTNCGPRFTIMEALPYDRARTTMADFQLCDDCRFEYENPGDRRFHAQPIACPACGPTLALEPVAPNPLMSEPLAAAIERLLAGEIVAIKGLGGFHLACDATNPAAICTLRDRKNRAAKPFALMGKLEVIRRYTSLSEAEAALLTAPDAPIVLLETSGEALPAIVAPGMNRLGWMLPHTPLHYLLVEAIARPLIMTSGNLSDEPQPIGNDEAKEKLEFIADSFLFHDRRIARRLDDSVVLPTMLAPMVIRRGRGQTPGTIALPASLPNRQVIAYGGELKAAICLTKNSEAMLSHHLGDLDNALAYEEFLRADHDLADLIEHRPEMIAVDLHPDYRASRYGREQAVKAGLPIIEVQHHHAHMAGALGGAGWREGLAVGIILDGLGMGPDGSIWGGELLLGDYLSVRRAGQLANAPLPGGEQAQREPWRNALMRLDAAGLSHIADYMFPKAPREQLRQAVARGLNSPPSSSLGRLFDAIAACLGIVPERQSFEGEAAMRLEALAATAPPHVGAYELPDIDGILDPAPMFHALVSDLDSGTCRATIGARCHSAIAKGFARLGRKVAQEAGATTIALSGGCMQNRLLLEQIADELADYTLCGPGPVPVNDGGLAFGQALVALAQTRELPCTIDVDQAS